ncbi:hypothetical protein EFL77_02370 [Pediococcus pentosaceus]|uniref:hypothetical protein n=1 Tax=Pediococcus pentosaceus TaxID=1255 RepID=UPI00223BCB79|nr:hypothetical protein [Pediococcus pentosaceus]MCT1177363.1 hypothetical protein [Pediococcus pentosaceus]
MKKWIWAVLIFLVAGVVGGYAVAHYHEEQVQYERNITNGKTAIDQTNYTAAKNYFSRAITIRKDDQQAANLLAQTKMYMRASSEFKSNEFTSARGDYQTVLTYKKASATLKQRSETKVKLIDKIKQNVKKFNKKLTTAKQKNEAWDFYGSNAIIDGLLSDKEFSKEYYKTIYDQALVLQRFNNAGIVADQNSFNTDTTPDNNENSMESGSGQQGLPRYGGPIPSSTAVPDKTVPSKKNSSKSVTKKTAKSNAKESSSSSATENSSTKKNEQTGSSSKAESSKTKSRSTEDEDIPISDTIEE